MKMSGTIPKVIEDSLLRCQLCMKSFTNPKQLPCLHSFCEKCLTRYVKTVLSDKEKHQRQSALLDAKLLEEAMKGSGLDREIPVHGYDDVVGGDYPSLPRLSFTPRNNSPRVKQLNTPDNNHSDGSKSKEHEYSEIPTIGTLDKKIATKSGDIVNKSEEKDSAYGSSSEGIVNSPTGSYSLERSPTLSPSYLPMSRAERTKSDPVQDKFKLSPSIREETTRKTQSARSSTVVNDSFVNSLQNCGRGGNLYIPMKSAPSNLNKTISNAPLSPISPGITYETMDTSTEEIHDLKNENEDTYLPNVTSKKLQSINLTGFGSIGVVPLFKKRSFSETLANSDSDYQLEKAVNVGDRNSKLKLVTEKKEVKTAKLKTSKSVDMLSGVPNVYVDKNSVIDIDIEKRTSDGDIKAGDATARPLSTHMSHSVSTPYMATANELVNSVTSDHRSPGCCDVESNEAWTLDISSNMSTCDNDGYETPINKRKPLGNLSADVLPELEIDINTQTNDNSDNNGVPDLPPKMGSNKTSPTPPNRTRRGNANLALKTSEGKRRQAVGETIILSSPSPTANEPEALLSSCDTTRDSVFDHIYEEIQCDEKNVSLYMKNANESNKNVPMLTTLSANSAHVHNLLQKHHGKRNTTPGEALRVRKVKHLLKKSKSTTEQVQSGHYDIPVVGLQLGNKLMRKSQSLSDDNGFSYISDQFEKVHIQHNDEDIELIYSEVCDVENATSVKELNQLNCDEIMCPVCSASFKLSNSKSVSSLPDSTFIENLKETRDHENTLKPNCKECGKHAKADFKCLECDHYLCKKCNDSHNWSKIVKGHKVITFAQLQSGMFTNEIMSKKQQVCPNHNSETPQYYCDTCSISVCKECAYCYHNEHRCQLISDVAKRGSTYLQNFESATNHMSHKFKTENLQLDKYRVQYNSMKQKAITDITKQYVHARDLLDDAYQELLRHIDFRYTEETMYLEEVQRRNEQFINRVELTNKLADHVIEYGSQNDIINISDSIASSLLEMEKYTPFRMEHKMDITFKPLASARPIDILPLIGQVTREYKPIKRIVTKELSPGIPQDNRTSKQLVTHLNTFAPKTSTDKKGCKPTGIALTKEDNIVLVDDINRKIKIFNDEGDLIREIVPHNADELIDPWDVTVTNYGNFAVTDRGSKKVKIFDPDGDLVCHFGPHLANPWGICCNRDGDLLITDTDHKCVFVHDSNGNLKYRVDPPSNMAKFPEYVTTNSLGDIIVSDLKAHCIYVFNLLGQFLFKIGPSDPNNPGVKLLHSPCGVYSDLEDNILVADYEMMRVSKFDKNGRFLSHFLTYMDNLRAPQSLIVNRKDHVILSDGTFIKTFTAGDFELWDIATTTEVDLELKPKVYNIRQSRKMGKKEPEITRSLSDGEEEKGELNRNDRQRRTVHTPVRRADHIKITKRQINPIAAKSPGTRSSSVPPKNSNINKHSGLPNNAFNMFKAVINYDSPQVSVQKIKQKLNSLDRSDSSSSSSARSSVSPEKTTKPPMFKNYEISKVSIDKRKEKLLNHAKQPADHLKLLLEDLPSDLAVNSKSNEIKDETKPLVNNLKGKKISENVKPIPVHDNNKPANKLQPVGMSKQTTARIAGSSAKPKLSPKPSFNLHSDKKQPVQSKTNRYVSLANKSQGLKIDAKLLSPSKAISAADKKDSGRKSPRPGNKSPISQNKTGEMGRSPKTEKKMLTAKKEAKSGKSEKLNNSVGITKIEANNNWEENC